MNVQVKPPGPPVMPQSIPLGFFSGIALLVIFGWAWSEFFLLLNDSWLSSSPGLLVAALAYFVAFRRWPVPHLLQVLGFALLAAVATFRLITIHETSDADLLGGIFCGLMVFAVVAMDQNQIKQY